VRIYIVPRFLDCGNSMNGFARIRCVGCGGDMRILAFITDPRVVDKILRHEGVHGRTA